MQVISHVSETGGSIIWELPDAMEARLNEIENHTPGKSEPVKQYLSSTLGKVCEILNGVTGLGAKSGQAMEILDNAIREVAISALQLTKQ